MARTVPILLYHSVTTDADPRFRRWTVTPELFTEHMAHLATNGYHSYTLSEYGEWLRGERDLADPAVVITFDDGFDDFATSALPIMRDHGLSSTLFLSTAYLGGTSLWLADSGEADRPMLDWSDLDSIQGADLEFGAHGHTHRMLDTLPLADAVDDIDRCKTLLEQRLGQPVSSLAYPHGYSTPSLRRELAGLGFLTASGVKHAMSSRSDDPYSLARIIVQAGTGVAEFDALLQGIGLRIAPPSSSPAIAGWRTYRRIRARVRPDRKVAPV